MDCPGLTTIVVDAAAEAAKAPLNAAARLVAHAAAMILRMLSPLSRGDAPSAGRAGSPHEHPVSADSRHRIETGRNAPIGLRGGSRLPYGTGLVRPSASMAAATIGPA